MKRNKFSLSNYKLLTCDQGELVPCGLMEVLPGDSVQHSTSALVRATPLLSPIMHPVNVRIHHWFVPNRLIWDDWESFITGGEDGADASVFPTITHGGGTGVANSSLADYLGVPPGVNNIVTSALPFRAAALVWNEWYRDQDLQTKLVIDTSDGADVTTDLSLQNVCWEKDYFTTARPWTQLGDEISLPLGTVAPIRGTAVDTEVFSENSATERPIQLENGTGQLQQTGYTGTTSDMRFVTDSAKIGLEADLSTATAASINDLREAIALQKYREARARYGARYTEYLRYLGINPKDSRLGRPEYLGGGRQTLQFSEILQTGVTTDGATAGVGNMHGHGIGAMRSNRYRKFFEEHGYVISFIVTLPKTMYSQGLPKTWSRTTKEDFFQKELQGIGQEEVLNKELYAAHASPDGTFGYQDRYDGYRRTESTLSAEFRGGEQYDHWHMARIFAGDPTLNAAFVKSNPTVRCQADQTNHSLLIMANHSIQARRMLAKTGKPGGLT